MLRTLLRSCRGVPDGRSRRGHVGLHARVDRRHRLEAFERLDPKVLSSIVESAVVFPSQFDENPSVYRACCPPRSAYASEPGPGEPRPPLPRLEQLLESGQVLGLNFPVALNPALPPHGFQWIREAPRCNCRSAGRPETFGLMARTVRGRRPHHLSYPKDFPPTPRS